MQLKHTIAKKGITFNVLYMIPRLFFLVIVLLTVVFLLNIFLNIKADTFYVEADLFTQELLYSPHGISYFDNELYRLFPGTINKEEFISGEVESRINNKSFYYGKKNQHIAAKITLKDGKGQNIHSIFYNKGQGKAYGYEFWQPMAKANIKGKGASKYSLKTIPALIKEKQKIIPGSILFEVVIPNT